MSITKLDINFRWYISYFMKVYVMGCKIREVGDLEVLHISNDFMVVNKQFDIPINSDTPESHPVTVADQLNHKYPNLFDPSVTFGFRFCHRLDFSTSGILCIALNKNAAKQGYVAINSRKAEKYYLALVYGHVQEDSITIDKGIGIDSRPDYSHRMCTSDKDYCLKPKLATSKLLVLQRGIYNHKPATKVLLKLITGRRHQLRVHCNELGHTIVGDYTYSDRKDIFPYRMFLHSFRLYLPSEIEKIDICTSDPFTELEPKNKWQPTQTVNVLNSGVYSLLK